MREFPKMIIVLGLGLLGLGLWQMLVKDLYRGLTVLLGGCVIVSILGIGWHLKRREDALMIEEWRSLRATNRPEAPTDESGEDDAPPEDMEVEDAPLVEGIEDACLNPYSLNNRPRVDVPLFVDEEPEKKPSRLLDMLCLGILFTALALFGPELPSHVPFLFVFAAHVLGPALMVLAGIRWVREAGEESGATGAFERLLALIAPVFWKGVFFLFWFIVLGLATCEAPNFIAR